MSIPRLGIINEVSGDFYQGFDFYQDKNENFIIIKLENDSLKLDSYYKKLIQENKVFIDWKLVCDSTFLQRYPKDNVIKIKDTDISKKCEIFYSLVCLEDFNLEPNESFNQFFNRNYNIKKGMILSAERKEIFWANDDNIQSYADFIKIEVNNAVDAEYLHVNFDNDIIIITTNDEDLKKDFEYYDNKINYKLINRELLLSNIIINAIRRIGEAEEENSSVDVQFKWAEYLKKQIGIQEDELEDLKDYNFASDLYYNSYDGEKLLSRAFKKLDNL